jgi:hypothetical protein
METPSNMTFRKNHYYLESSRLVSFQSLVCWSPHDGLSQCCGLRHFLVSCVTDADFWYVSSSRIFIWLFIWILFYCSFPFAWGFVVIDWIWLFHRLKFISYIFLNIFPPKYHKVLYSAILLFLCKVTTTSLEMSAKSST